MRFIILISSTLFLFTACSYGKPVNESGGSITIKSSIEPSETVPQGQTVALKIQLEAEGNQKMIEPHAKGPLKGFDIISRSVSTQIHSVNGRMSNTLELILILQAQEQGVWTIPSYEITDENGKLYATNEIQIKVTSSNDTGKHNQKKKKQPGSDLRLEDEKTI